MVCCFESYGGHRDLHGRTHSYPTGRSSDLDQAGIHHGHYRSGLVADLDGRNVERLEHHAAAVDQNEFAVAMDEPAAAAIECRAVAHTSELQSLMRISYAVVCSIKQRTARIDLLDRKRTPMNSQHYCT